MEVKHSPKHSPKWNDDLKCWRLIHPTTGDFIAEYYPGENVLVVTKHRKTAKIELDLLYEPKNIE